MCARGRGEVDFESSGIRTSFHSHAENCSIVKSLLRSWNLDGELFDRTFCCTPRGISQSIATRSQRCNSALAHKSTHSYGGKFVRSNLCSQVSEIVIDQAAWPFPTSKLIFDSIESRCAIFDNHCRFDHDAFLLQSGRIWRHRSWSRSTNLRVMRSICSETNQFAGWSKDRCDDRQIG